MSYCNRYNSFGRCNTGGLAYGSRIGIGVAIAVAVVVLIAVFSILARRRRRNRVAVHSTQGTSEIPMGQSNQYGGYNTGYAQPSPYGQSYQAQSYGPPAGPPPGNHDESTYAPPPGAPPPAYAPNNKNAENNA